MLPATGSGRVARLGPGGAAATREVRGWPVLDSFVDRFAPAEKPRLTADFAAVAAEWEAAPASVVYTVAGERDVLVGLSYQTTPAEVLAAVWSAVLAEIVSALADLGVDGPVRLVSAHPGAAALAARLDRAAAADRPGLDALVRRVAAVAAEPVR